jgi:hypothetical protein
MASTFQPATQVGFQRIARYNHGVDATALPALEHPEIEARRPSFKLGKKHVGLLTLRAAGPLDGGKISGWHGPGYWHHASLD